MMASGSDSADGMAFSEGVTLGSPDGVEVDQLPARPTGDICIERHPN